MSLERKLAYMANNEADRDRYSIPGPVAAARRGLGCKAVSRACLLGELDAVKKGRTWFIDEESFRNWRPTGRGKRKVRT